MSGYTKQVAQVEKFMVRIACLRGTDNPRDRGNIAIAFLAKPRRFKVHIMADTGNAEGEGETLLGAIEALVESLERSMV